MVLEIQICRCKGIWIIYYIWGTEILVFKQSGNWPIRWHRLAITKSVGSYMSPGQKTHIWVSFLRTGIGPELCPFLEKFGKMVWKQRKQCFVKCLWDIFLLKLLEKIARSPWHHYTTLHSCIPLYTTLQGYTWV